MRRLQNLLRKVNKTLMKEDLTKTVFQGAIDDTVRGITCIELLLKDRYLPLRGGKGDRERGQANGGRE